MFHEYLMSKAFPFPGLPIFTIIRLGATDSCIFKCETSWSQHIKGNSCSNNDPRPDCQHDYVRSAGSKICGGSRNHVMSTQLPIWEYQCATPRTARMEDKHSKVLGRSFQYPHRDGQLQRRRGIGNHMAYGLSPVALLSTGSKLTEGKLLPPIKILSQGCDSSEPSRKAVVSSALQDLYSPLRWSAGNGHGHGHGTGEISNPDKDPTYPTVGKHEHGSLDSKICFPITPPISRVPTPLDKFTPPCLRKRPGWGQSTMTQFDPSITWVLQELEVLLTDFPMTSLRVQSPVIQKIRSSIPIPPVAERCPVRHRSVTPPHSRYSPYRPVVDPNASILNAHSGRPPQQTRASCSTQANPTILALRAVFPSARGRYLDSLYATYLALHYVVSLPASDFAAASALNATASPSITSAKHSRSSSMVSNVPSKARAMLGLESPVQISPMLPSPAKSWFRASTSELDRGLKIRLENVELLLETSVRKILVEIEGRSLGTLDGALVRAVGEIVRMGEQRSSARAS
ncbi:MAG: hypothetical protein Q9210_000819 [Variospora velana]